MDSSGAPGGVRDGLDIRWHGTGFQRYWRWKSHSRGGRPKVPVEIRRLFREMSLANRLWAADLWRTAQARISGPAVDCRKVHGEERARTVTDLEDIPSHSCGRLSCHGLPGCADGRLKLLFVLVILRHQRRHLISQSDGQSDGGGSPARSPMPSHGTKRRTIPLNREAKELNGWGMARSSHGACLR
jgi:hypothetical protein